MFLIILLLALFVNTITFVGPVPELRLVETVPTTFIVLGEFTPGDETLAALVTSPIVLVLNACNGPFVNAFKSFKMLPLVEFVREECNVWFLELLSSFKVDLLSIDATLLMQLFTVNCLAILEPTPFCWFFEA